jgi:hypothetical protein
LKNKYSFGLLKKSYRKHFSEKKSKSYAGQLKSLHSDLGDKLKKDVKDKSETLEGDKKKYYPLPYSVNQSRY